MNREISNAKANASYLAGCKAERDRHQAVFASEHYFGKRRQANKLLGNDKLSAVEIIALLAYATDGGKAAAKAAALETWNHTLEQFGWKG